MLIYTLVFQVKSVNHTITLIPIPVSSPIKSRSGDPIAPIYARQAKDATEAVLPLGLFRGGVILDSLPHRTRSVSALRLRRLRCHPGPV